MEENFFARRKILALDGGEISVIQNEIRDRFMKSVNSISLFAYLMPYSSYYIAIRNAILEIKKNSFGEAFIYVGTKPFLSDSLATRNFPSNMFRITRRHV